MANKSIIGADTTYNFSASSCSYLRKNLDYTFIFRYLAPQSWNKSLKKNELSETLHNGLYVGLYFELDAADPLGKYAASWKYILQNDPKYKSFSFTTAQINSMSSINSEYANMEPSDVGRYHVIRARKYLEELFDNYANIPNGLCIYFCDDTVAAEWDLSMRGNRYKGVNYNFYAHICNYFDSVIETMKTELPMCTVGMYARKSVCSNYAQRTRSNSTKIQCYVSQQQTMTESTLRCIVQSAPSSISIQSDKKVITIQVDKLTITSDHDITSFGLITPSNVNSKKSDSGAISENEVQHISYVKEVTLGAKTVTTERTRDSIKTLTTQYNEFTSGTNLLSYPSLVEAPYVNVTIGTHTFGKYQKTKSGTVIYPNFINSMRIVKINGSLNTYSIDMIYQVRDGDDPNFMDKIFSSVGYGKIKISYGDYASPSFVYREEEAIITKVTTDVDFGSSQIRYNISCTSSAFSILGTTFSFDAVHQEKPSSVIKRILRDGRYRLNEVFTAMSGTKFNSETYLNKLIATDDAPVDIPAKNAMDPLSYINFLVTYMVPETSTTSSTIKDAYYYITIHDASVNTRNSLGGTYFTVTRVNSKQSVLPTSDVYTVDVGYPGGDNPGENLVMSFNLQENNSWALLYNYANSNIAYQQQYSYSIDSQGQLVQNYSPNITTNAVIGTTTAAMKSWWTKMTQFPISATITIKGLLRPAMLMSYLKINSYFFGKKHVSSGLYLITKQEDQINGSGYRTTLSLSRIAGADDYIVEETYLHETSALTATVTSKKKVETEYITTTGGQGATGKIGIDPDMANYSYTVLKGATLLQLTILNAYDWISNVKIKDDAYKESYKDLKGDAKKVAMNRIIEGLMSQFLFTDATAWPFASNSSIPVIVREFLSNNKYGYGIQFNPDGSYDGILNIKFTLWHDEVGTDLLSNIEATRNYPNCYGVDVMTLGQSKTFITDKAGLIGSYWIEVDDGYSIYFLDPALMDNEEYVIRQEK